MANITCLSLYIRLPSMLSLFIQTHITSPSSYLIGAEMVQTNPQNSRAPQALPGSFHSLQRGVFYCIHQEPSVQCSRIAVHWTGQNREASILSVRVGSGCTERQNTHGGKKGIRREEEGEHQKRNTTRDERRHPCEQHHECRSGKEAGGTAEDRSQFLSDQGIEGSCGLDGVLRCPRLRGPPHHPCAHLREPLQGEKVLLCSPLSRKSARIKLASFR